MAEDPAFTRTSWKAERIGWSALLLFLAAGLAGLLGPGLWPRARAAGRDGFLLRYDRFGYADTESDLEFRLPRGPGDGRTTSFWLDDPYLSGVVVERIDPDPVRTLVGNGRTEYQFDCAAGGSALPVRIRFSFRRPGTLAGRSGHGDDVLEFRQFVYP